MLNIYPTPHLHISPLTITRCNWPPGWLAKTLKNLPSQIRNTDYNLTPDTVKISLMENHTLTEEEVRAYAAERVRASTCLHFHHFFASFQGILVTSVSKLLIGNYWSCLVTADKTHFQTLVTKSFWEDLKDFGKVAPSSKSDLESRAGVKPHHPRAQGERCFPSGN